MIAFLLMTASATRLELEATSAYRIQQAGEFAEEDLYVYVPSETLTSGGRIRLESDDAHIGFEMHGAADKIAVLRAERAQRYGGLRALFGFRGRTPRTTTLTHIRVGAAAWDFRDIAESDHQPVSLGTLGLEVRRFKPRRFQSLEAEVMGNGVFIGAELRTRVGYEVRDTGLYLTVGGATSRLQAWQSTARQVTYQIETSVLWRPGGGR